MGVGGGGVSCRANRVAMDTCGAGEHQSAAQQLMYVQREKLVAFILHHTLIIMYDCGVLSLRATVDSLRVWRRGWGHWKQEGGIYLKSEWWAGGGRDTGPTGSFQEDLESSGEGLCDQTCVGRGSGDGGAPETLGAVASGRKISWLQSRKKVLKKKNTSLNSILTR